MNPGRFTAPKPLLPGGSIGLFAPSGVVNLPRMNAAVDALVERGYRVVIAPEVDKQWRYFSGTDVERLSSFHSMLADSTIDAMMMVRGGYGWSRLLHRIDWDAVAKSQKTFVGFSDFTAFNLAALSQANLITFAGPGAAIDFGGSDDKPETQIDHAFMEAHCWPALAGDAVNAGPFIDSFTYRPRTISGPLWGSNLSLLAHLVGSPFLPDIEGGILFLEEIGEAPYAIERMLLQLFHAGVLQKQKAIILADFTDCLPEPDRFPYAMEHVIETLRELLPIPVLTGLPFGHVAKKLTLPYGAIATLNIAPGSFALSY
ncbi:MAG: LD-carboxypeptidase [Burkholderiales bacterium]|nr:LD-carboxypeptidase [Burkholderiales bacterium]